MYIIGDYMYESQIKKTKTIEESDEIYSTDKMVPIFGSISRTYINNWNKDGFDTWTHDVGKLYKIEIQTEHSWTKLEYPDGVEITISEDGIIRSKNRQGPRINIWIPEDWKLCNMIINNDEIKIKRGKI